MGNGSLVSGEIVDQSAWRGNNGGHYIAPALTLNDMAKIWWSATQKSIKERLCEPLKKRIQVHRTLYRGSHNGCQMDDGAGRFWILLDREQIFSASDSGHWKEVSLVRDELRHASGSTQSGDAGWHDANDKALAIIRARGVYSHFECVDGLNQYLKLSIEDAVLSPNKLVKAFAMVDRRLGKRRIKELELPIDEHDLVKRFYELRCSVEGLSAHGIASH